MKIIKSFSYRFAEEILDSAFKQLKNEKFQLFQIRTGFLLIPLKQE